MPENELNENPHPPDLHALRILLATKQACDANQRSLRKIAEWSSGPVGAKAFGEIVTHPQIQHALFLIERHRRLHRGTLFGRGVGDRARQLNAGDAETQECLLWAERVIAAFNENEDDLKSTSCDVPCKTLTISSENYVAVAILPEVIKKFNDDRTKNDKAPVRFVIRELTSVNAAKEDHRRSSSSFVLHSVRPARKGERQTWTQEEGMTLVKRKISGMKIETAIKLPDMAFIPQADDFTELWSHSEILGEDNPLERPSLKLKELEKYPVALVGNIDDDIFGKLIPGSTTPRVLVDSMAAAARLVETGRFVGLMNIYGCRLLRGNPKVLLRPIEQGRPPVYLQAFCREKNTLTVEAQEFLDTLFTWLWADTPGPKPKISQ